MKLLKWTQQNKVFQILFEIQKAVAKNDDIYDEVIGEIYQIARLTGGDRMVKKLGGK